MLRAPQHERKITSEINSPPFVLSRVEGLRERFFNNLLNLGFTLALKPAGKVFPFPPETLFQRLEVRPIS